MGDKIPKRFRHLFNHLQETWFAHNDCYLFDPFTKGFTDAFVVPISLAIKQEFGGAAEGNTYREKEEILSGEFVLKLYFRSESEEKTEDDHHEEARKWNVPFAEKHMPALKRHEKMGDGVALLYDIANHKLYEIESAETKDAADLRSCVQKVSRSLLDEWNHTPHYETTHQAWDLIEQWSAYRLQANKLRDVGERLTQGKLGFCFLGQTLVNPLRLKETGAGKKEYPGHPIRGMLHNDLHLRNILAPKKKDARDFWLIDFAHADEGFLLYDHAYLEVSLLLKDSGRFGKHTRLHKLLTALEAGPKSRPNVDGDDLCLFDCIVGLRDEVESWPKRMKQRTLEGPLRAQFLLV